MQSPRKQALRQVFPVHPGGRAEGIPRDSCRMETAHGETKGESDPRLGAGARSLVTFPWELGTVTDGHGSHWHYDQGTLQSILSAEGCVTGPCPSQGMAAEQVAFSRASTEDPTANTQPLLPTFYHRALCFLENASFIFFSWDGQSHRHISWPLWLVHGWVPGQFCFVFVCFFKTAFLCVSLTVLEFTL